MTGVEWGVWIGYEIVVAVVVYTKSVFWFRRQSQLTHAALQSWVGLLLLAFFTAYGLSQWLEASFLAAPIAFGLASAMILSAAVNAAYEAGLKDGERLRGSEAQKPEDE